MTVLPRAPELAPVPDRNPGPPPSTDVAVAVPPSAPAQRSRPPAGGDREPGVAGVGGLIVRQHLRVAAVHQEVMAAHTEAHQRFLRMSARTVTALTTAATTAGSAPAPVRLPATPAAAQGPTFDRAQLEHLASREISALFGPRFAEQDGYAVQTRMPGPPMLFADRVTGIDAVPAALVLPGPVRTDGRIWTETDVLPDSWYLDSTGRMPAGVLIEAGQADLLLLSWLGVDLLNRGERAYRLLGCEVTFHGSPPRPGDTLCFEIHVDGHAEADGVRLAFFHYDCYVDGELRLSVREGQAGLLHPGGAGRQRWNPLGSRRARARGRSAARSMRPCAANGAGSARTCCARWRRGVRRTASGPAGRRRRPMCGRPCWMRSGCGCWTRSRRSTRPEGRGAVDICARRPRFRPTTGSSPGTSRTTPACRAH